MAPAAFNLAVLVGERKPARGGAAGPEGGRRCAPGEPRYAWTLGYYQARAGDRKGASATLRALLAVHPEHAEARALLADVERRP